MQNSDYHSSLAESFDAPASLEQVRAEIDAPMLAPKFTQVTLQGDGLVVTVDVKPRIQWLAIGLIILGSVLMSFDAGRLDLGGLICFGIPIFFGGFAFLKFDANRMVGAGRHQLRISAEGIRISEDGVGGDELLPMGQLKQYFLEGRPPRTDGQSTISRPPSPGDREVVRPPGIYFRSADDFQRVFDLRGIISQGRLLRIKSSTSEDFLELEWIFWLVRQYMLAIGVYPGSPKSPELVAPRRASSDLAPRALPTPELESQTFELDVAPQESEVVSADWGENNDAPLELEPRGFKIPVVQEDTDPW
ncbi:hypothetical protein [Bradymonas sediminis]|uniref:Uncharacterized protein n=1 Tax=Bradymonas sediminis TaxID=1548548 RepID=A0A2Z4FHC4_9DELT|nr:hypothetical protein [Bradymonas sediminis]AWV88309.1 hypothetical protein DN745_02715 [Bradymonas sediminis]TDP77434.1 hypothetical protein DFR33_101336 [Bradymonas sediminis]